MSTSSQAHAALVSSVAERYQQDGYQVNVEPGPSAVPFDLGGYRPDIIARKGNLSLIVAVKAQAEKTSFDRLRSLVDETKRHKGWRFVLVSEQDVLGLDLQGENENQISWEEIEQRIEHADRLSNVGDNESAYLVLWITFERMMRYRAHTVGLPLERLAPSILIRQLYSQGELTIAQFDIALKCQELRNRIIHGFHGSDIKQRLELLRSLLGELLTQWSALKVEGVESHLPAHEIS